MPKITIHDVAREAKVSIGTVYRAVNNTGRINEETRKRVLEIVERLGYRANSVARGLALRNKFNILVIMPQYPEIFWNDLIKGARRAAAELSEFGVSILEFYHTYGKIGDLTPMEILKTQKVDAIAMSIVNFEDYGQLLAEAAASGIPVALFNEDAEGTERLFYYGPDNRLAGRMAAELMVKFCGRSGSCCILSLQHGGTYGASDTDSARQQGFRDYLREHDVDFQIAGCCVCSAEESPVAVRRILNEQPEINGFYFTQYTQLQSSYRLFRGLKKKYTVIGHEYGEELGQALRNGEVDALLVQEKVCQGYYPVKMLYDYLVTGEKTQRNLYFSNNNIIIGANMDCLQYSKNGCGYE